MNPYLIFILGGVSGAIVYKVVSDFIAKRKRKKFIETLLASTEKVVDYFEEKDKESQEIEEEDEDDNLIDIQEVLKDLREKESPEDE